MSTFLMTPEQHHQQAERLRRTGDPKLQRLAQDHDNLARVIEARLREARCSEPADSTIGGVG
jgi:hypothetical protein